MPEITLLTVASNKTLRVYGSGFSEREDDSEAMPCGYHIKSLGGFPGSPPFTFDGIINAMLGNIQGTDVDITMVTGTGDYEFWITDQFLGDSNKFAFIIPATNTPWMGGVRPVGPAGAVQAGFERGKWDNSLCPTCGWWMQDELDPAGVRTWVCVNPAHPGTKPKR